MPGLRTTSTRPRLASRNQLSSIINRLRRPRPRREMVTKRITQRQALDPISSKLELVHASGRRSNILYATYQRQQRLKVEDHAGRRHDQHAAKEEHP